MEKLKSMLGEANRLYNIADHMTFSTYPMIGEIKLLMVATENLYKSLIRGIQAVIYYDRLYKRVPVEKGDPGTEFRIFRDRCMRRYNIDQSIVPLLRELKAILDARKASPIEFARKDKFIICSPSYKMNIVNLKKVKDYMAQGKLFINKMNQVVKVV